jgi:acid stress-induced BolA-like protein IbaG/YrbA
MEWEDVYKRKEEIKKIFDDVKSDLSNVDGDNAYLGLVILSKYSKNLIQCAEHDKIYSISLEDAIEANITDADIIELAKLNWMIDEDSFSCFV